MAQSDAALDPTDLNDDLWAGILPDALWKGRTGRGVRVAVVDSGIDTEHPALKGKVKESVEAVPEGGQILFKPSTSGDQDDERLSEVILGLLDAVGQVRSDVGSKILTGPVQRLGVLPLPACRHGR